MWKIESAKQKCKLLFWHEQMYLSIWRYIEYIDMRSVPFISLNTFYNNSFENENEWASLCCVYCSLHERKHMVYVYNVVASHRATHSQLLYHLQWIFFSAKALSLTYDSKPNNISLCGSYVVWSTFTGVFKIMPMMWKWLVWLVTLSDDFLLISFSCCTLYVNLFTIFRHIDFAFVFVFNHSYITIYTYYVYIANCSSVKQYLQWMNSNFGKRNNRSVYL